MTTTSETTRALPPEVHGAIGDLVYAVKERSATFQRGGHTPYMAQADVEDNARAHLAAAIHAYGDQRAAAEREAAEARGREAALVEVDAACVRLFEVMDAADGDAPHIVLEPTPREPGGAYTASWATGAVSGGSFSYRLRRAATPTAAILAAAAALDADAGQAAP